MDRIQKEDTYRIFDATQLSWLKQIGACFSDMRYVIAKLTDGRNFSAAMTDLSSLGKMLARHREIDFAVFLSIDAALLPKYELNRMRSDYDRRFFEEYVLPRL